MKLKDMTPREREYYRLGIERVSSNSKKKSILAALTATVLSVLFLQREENKKK